jgi:peroxiredoxin
MVSVAVGHGSHYSSGSLSPEIFVPAPMRLTMTNRTRLFIPIALLTAVIGVAAGFGLYRWVHGPSELASPAVEHRPAFSLPDLGGTVRRISQWDGKVVLLNFWATWCPPCRKEIPGFIELQERYGPRGFQVVGVAIDDADKVQDFADTMGINYPNLIGDLEAIDIAKSYGDRLGSLPYSVVIDRSGRIVHSHWQGEFEREAVEQIIQPLL